SSGSGVQVVNKADTTISIGSSANPSVFGQPVSFTVTVGPTDPGVGTPTGNVSVFLNGSLLQTLALSGGAASTTPTSTVHAGTNFGTTPLSGGSAVSPPIASLPAGPHTVTATYVPETFGVPTSGFTCGSGEPFGPGCGTRDFNASQGSTGQVVNQAGTSTGMTADINP